MSNFKINEIKSWAKKFGISFKRSGEVFVWHLENEENNKKEFSDIEDAVKSIFNHISNNKWVEHQEGFISKKLA
jgi:hypothetical protein